MKVLHVQKVKGLAGSERHLLELLPRQRDHGFEAVMCVLLDPGGEAFATELRARGVPTVEIPAGRDLNPLLAPRVAGVIRAQRPHLVHTHLVHADTYGQLAARLTRVRSVRTVHGTGPVLARQPYRSAMAAAGRAARRTIAISEHARRFVLEAGLAPAERVRVVRYGVDAGGWAAGSGEREAARASFGIDGDAVAIGVASRLVPYKGHDFLLDGFGYARHDLPALQLLVAGDGPEREALQQQARPMGDSVRFLGYLGPERVKAFMHGCDLIAFPTLPEFGEGFGLAALEASAAGRPVVATRVASLPEIVDDGTTGVLVEPGDIAGLAGTLVRLGRDPDARSRMGTAGHLRARDQFSVERMVEETMAVYEEARRA